MFLQVVFKLPVLFHIRSIKNLTPPEDHEGLVFIVCVFILKKKQKNKQQEKAIRRQLITDFQEISNDTQSFSALDFIWFLLVNIHMPTCSQSELISQDLMKPRC